MLKEPPWTLEVLEDGSPPVPFPNVKSLSPNPQILSGIRVLELCRIIAGPAIGRTLAEYGADVIKVTSPYLSDVPFFQVDGYVNHFHPPPLVPLLHQDQYIPSWILTVSDVGVPQRGLVSNSKMRLLHFDGASFLCKSERILILLRLISTLRMA